MTLHEEPIKWYTETVNPKPVQLQALQASKQTQALVLKTRNWTSGDLQYLLSFMRFKTGM